jgi:predicted transcriptional regulator
VDSYLQGLQNQTENQSGDRAELRRLVTRLAVLTGRSRECCWRFVRRHGIAPRPYHEWTRSEQQRLLDLLSRQPVGEVAKVLHRSVSSIRAMLHRLGASAQMGRDWFTVYTLAEALHTSAAKVQRWIERGWLKTRIVEVGRLKKEIIEADSFEVFCREHGSDIVGNRLDVDRLEFVRMFVFAPSHTDLLPVRAAKKEQAAFDLLASKNKQQNTEEQMDLQE